MPLSLYARNKLIDHANGKAAYTAPTLYVGLSTTTPNGTDGNITAPSGGSYARVTTSAATWNTAASGTTTNAADIVFPAATGSWGTVTHVCVYDASTAGNLIWWGALSASQAITSGMTYKIPAGSATHSIS